MHVMSAQLPRFRFLAVTGGEGMYFTAPFVGELERHVSQSTDANDPDAGGGGYFMNQEWRKYCDAAAQERSHFCQVQRIGQRANPWPLSSNTIRKAAMAPNNGPLSSGAQVLVTGKTFVAVQTTVSGPAKPDALSNLEPFRRLAQCDNCAGHLMARHERVLGHAPFVIEHRKIRVTESTVRYFDFDLFRTKLAGVETERFQRAIRAQGGIGVEFLHNQFSFLELVF